MAWKGREMRKKDFKNLEEVIRIYKRRANLYVFHLCRVEYLCSVCFITDKNVSYNFVTDLGTFNS